MSHMLKYDNGSMNVWTGEANWWEERAARHANQPMREWHTSRSILRFRQQGLIEVEPACGNTMSGAGQIESPQSSGGLIHGAVDGRQVALQALSPPPKRQHKMFPETLDVPHLKAGGLCQLGCGGDQYPLGAWDHIRIHKWSECAAFSVANPNSMIQIDPARFG